MLNPDLLLGCTTVTVRLLRPPFTPCQAENSPRFHGNALRTGVLHEALVFRKTLIRVTSTTNQRRKGNTIVPSAASGYRMLYHNTTDAARKNARCVPCERHAADQLRATRTARLPVHTWLILPGPSENENFPEITPLFPSPTQGAGVLMPCTAVVTPDSWRGANLKPGVPKCHLSVFVFVPTFSGVWVSFSVLDAYPRTSSNSIRVEL